MELTPGEHKNMSTESLPTLDSVFCGHAYPLASTLLRRHRVMHTHTHHTHTTQTQTVKPRARRSVMLAFFVVVLVIICLTEGIIVSSRTTTHMHTSEESEEFAEETGDSKQKGML